MISDQAKTLKRIILIALKVWPALSTSYSSDTIGKFFRCLLHALQKIEQTATLQQVIPISTYVRQFSQKSKGISRIIGYSLTQLASKIVNRKFIVDLLETNPLIQELIPPQGTF
jgi:hypothetical protein